GSFTSIGGQFRNNLAELNTSTSSATSLNLGTKTIYALDTNGTQIYVGGDFEYAGTYSRNGFFVMDTSGNIQP
ncbi:MAG: hypothetical protein KDD45_12725, partial [Bdellovibrionales bacterium]|nr:hypothetical protein [Bdellovibrionales bacterium]